jgi:hypothetical protein
MLPSQPLFLGLSQHLCPVQMGSGAIPGTIGGQQRFGHPGGSSPFWPFDEVPVHILSDRDAGVSENLRDDVEIGALGQHQEPLSGGSSTAETGRAGRSARTSATWSPGFRRDQIVILRVSRLRFSNSSALADTRPSVSYYAAPSC